MGFFRKTKMNWLFTSELKDASLIDQYEQQIGYRFPADYRKCVLANNGGYPEKCGFDTDKYKGRAFNCLYSFNPGDTVTIWDFGTVVDGWTEKVMPEYVSFADSPFGDPICFDRRDNSIVFIDHETGQVEHVAPSFQALIDSLYEVEEYEG